MLDITRVDHIGIRISDRKDRSLPTKRSALPSLPALPMSRGARS